MSAQISSSSAPGMQGALQSLAPGSRIRCTKVWSPRPHGFVERFQRPVLDDRFRVKLRTTLYESLDALQADLDVCLAY
jgi:hypothetical protein